MMNANSMRLLTAGLGLCLAAWSWSAPHKAAGKSSATGSRAPAETVYVPVTPSPAFASSSKDSRETRTTESSPRDASARESSVHESDSHRTDAVFALGPTRDYASAFGLYAGFYSAEVLGNNPYGNFYYDLYPAGQPYFFEFTTGLATVQSSFSHDVIGGEGFKRNVMITFEGLAGFTLSGLAHGNGRAGGLFPYFVAGITYVDQGGVPFILPDGVPNFGGVAGFGNRMALPFGPKDGRWAINYGLRDHIYSQKLRTTPGLTQNFVLLIGVQKYY